MNKQCHSCRQPCHSPHPAPPPPPTSSPDLGSPPGLPRLGVLACLQQRHPRAPGSASAGLGLAAVLPGGWPHPASAGGRARAAWGEEASGGPGGERPGPGQSRGPGAGRTEAALFPPRPTAPSPLPAWRRRKTPGERMAAGPRLQGSPSRCWARPCPHACQGVLDRAATLGRPCPRGRHQRAACVGKGWGARGGPQRPRHEAAEGPSAFAASLPSQRVTHAPGFQTGH